MKKLPTSEASDGQLREYAEALQLDLDGCTTRAKLMGVLGPALGEQDFILVADDPPAAQTEAAAPIVEDYIDTHDNGPYVQFRILPTEMPGGKDKAYPSVNGIMLKISRDALVRAPYAFYLALKNAKSGTPYVVDHGGGKPPEIKFSDVTNYPLADVVLPPQAEIDAWHTRRGPKLLAA